MTRQRHLALHLAALAALSTILPGTAGPPGAAAIEDLEAEDVPPECVQVCTPIVQLTARCEAQAEQRFGTDRRWIGQRQAVDGLERETRGRRGKRRTLQRMLGTRLGRRQERQDDSDDSDDSDYEGATPQRPGNAAAGTEQREAANKAAAESVMRACVCGERGFDVAAAAFGCATCVAQNGTAAEANEDIRQIIAECGFVDAPALTTTTPPPPAVLAPAISTVPPAFLAPAESSTFSTTTVPLTTPPPPPTIPPTIPTSSTPLPSAEPPATQAPPLPTTSSSQLPAEASPTQSSESITPVTVFETPSFSTLPPIVLPNDVSSTPPVLDDENQMSGAARGLDMLGGWLQPSRVVWVVVIGLILA